MTWNDYIDIAFKIFATIVITIATGGAILLVISGIILTIDSLIKSLPHEIRKKKRK